MTAAPLRAAPALRGRRREPRLGRLPGLLAARPARARSRRPGQFYMLATERRWEQRGGRPFLPRALSVAEAGPADGGARLDFLIEAVGPGTERLCELEAGEGVWVNGPLGNAFSEPRELGARRRRGDPRRRRHRHRAAGAAAAPLRRARRPDPSPARLPRPSALRRPRRPLLQLPRSASPARTATLGHRGYVTDLLAAMLEGDDAGSAAVYACGPPPMLEAVRALCAARGVACELALESPMACGFGACFGCAVPQRRAAATCASASTARSSAGDAGRRGGPCLTSAGSSSRTR